MARILLIDDEESILKSLAALLGTAGHETMAARTGAEAMELIQAEAFDLVITDIRMAPMDGMELLRRAAEEKPELPVIVVSAFSSDKTVEQSFDHGSRAYIKKPFKVQDVLATVESVLAGEPPSTIL